MKNLNTPKDLMDIFPLTIEITQKHLDKGDIDSPFTDPLALVILDTLKPLLTPNFFKEVLVLSGIYFVSINVKRQFQINLCITKDDTNISVRSINTPTKVILKERVLIP